MQKTNVGIEVKFPKNIYLTLLSAKISKDTMDKKMKQAFSMQLYKNGILSIAKAAELSEMCLSDFMDLLVDNEIPVVEYTEEDYVIDKKTIADLRRK